MRIAHAHFYALTLVCMEYKLLGPIQLERAYIVDKARNDSGHHEAVPLESQHRPK